MTDTWRRADFWCETCRDWTAVDTPSYDTLCSVCGDAYTCGECGYEIDREGRCLRPAGWIAGHP